MSPFTDPVIKTLTTDESNVASDPKNYTPLLSEEEINDEQPPRINMTAVVCTAIVAVCATIILCVARPWRNGSEEQYAMQTDVPASSLVKDDNPEKKADASEAKPQQVAADAKKEDAKPVEPKTEPAKPAETKPVEPKPIPEKQAGLPVVPVTTTGTANPYNSVRLIDASSRKLTEAEVAKMNKAELALARNAIYARHGYVYKNAELGEFFSKQTWFKPNKTLKLEDVKPLFTDIEVANINLIIAQEKK